MSPGDAFDHLKQWRLEESHKDNVKAFQIFSDRVLHAISEKMPATLDEFDSISGVSDKQVSKYGQSVLRILEGVRTQDTHSTSEISHKESNAIAESEMSVSAFVDRLNRWLSKIKVKIRWEISQWKVHSEKWHAYFSLKDTSGESVIECVMFKSVLSRADFEPGIGTEVVISGSPNVYEKTGRFSVKVESMELAGEWAIRRNYELLKAKLQKEWLFDAERKKEIPKYVRSMGVITSKEWAVIHDFRKNIWKRGFKINLIDTRVEWISAIREISSAIKKAQTLGIDVIILIRWWWSLESMAAFNDEGVVRLIANSKIPVICGIGHETDMPLACMAASKSCSTPSMVAQEIDKPYVLLEQTVESKKEKLLSSFQSLILGAESDTKTFAWYLRARFDSIGSSHREKVSARSKFIATAHSKVKSFASFVDNLGSRMFASQTRNISKASKIVESATEIPERLHMRLLEKIKHWILALDRSVSILESLIRATHSDVWTKGKAVLSAFGKSVGHSSSAISRHESILKAHDPTRLLALGYGLITLNGKVVKSVSQVSQGDIIESQVSDGTFASKVIIQNP